MLLIGSRAAKYHFSNFRDPVDYDLIATENEINNFLKNKTFKDISKHSKKKVVKINNITFEFEISNKIKSSKLFLKKETKFPFKDSLFGKYFIASPEALLAMKRSHIIFPIHFHKNINDYHYLKNKISLDKEYIDLSNLRRKEILERDSFKELNFNLSNSDFFKRSKQNVHRYVNHDLVHQAIAFYDKPLFLQAKIDINNAALDIDLVNKMSDKLKIQLIQEEAIVLSLERYIIPNLIMSKSFNSKDIYKKMCYKMVYNYLPMFMRDFAADNIFKIIDLNINYVDKFILNCDEFSQIYLNELKY